jgi:hypothetical protein
MKITKTQLKEIIREELNTLNENVNLDRVADLYAYYGMDSSRWNDKTVDRYGQDVVDAAKKLLPHMKRFEKNIVDALNKIRNDKMYPLLLEVINAEASYAGGRGHTSFGDLMGYIAHRNNIKLR